MGKLIAVLHIGEDAESKQLKVSIENEIEQIAALINSAKELPLIEFFDAVEEICFFASKKKGFIIYDGTWSIFAQDIAEHMAKTKQTVKISNCWIDDEEQHLENLVKIIEAQKIPIDYTKWEEALRLEISTDKGRQWGQVLSF
jgi:arginyl-tRNA synthetase